MESIKSFFEKTTSTKIKEIYPLPASGSSRRNFVVSTNNENFIVTTNDNIAENKAFIYFSNLFSSLKLNTPKIIGIDDDEKSYIQTFLGEETLSEIITKEGESQRVKDIIKKTLDALFELQQKTIDKVDYSKTFEYQSYNKLPILHDCYYFKFFLVDILEIEYQKAALLIEFEKLTCIIESISPKGLMLRDFQSRNIVIHKNQPFFIDYQSAMYGPLLYDVVSMLFQIKANFSEKLIDESLKYYIQKFEPNTQKDFEKSLSSIKLIRNMQVLGAYGFRGLVQRKAHFLNSLKMGVSNIIYTFEHWEKRNDFPEINKIIKQLKSEKIQAIINKNIDNL